MFKALKNKLFFLQKKQKNCCLSECINKKFTFYLNSLDGLLIMTELSLLITITVVILFARLFILYPTHLSSCLDKTLAVDPTLLVTQSTITRTLHDNKSHCVFPVAGERSLTHIFPLCYLIHDWASPLHTVHRHTVMPIVPGTSCLGRTGTATKSSDQAGCPALRMAARYGKKGSFWRAGTSQRSL